MRRKNLLAFIMVCVIILVVTLSASIWEPTLAQRFLWAPPPTPTVHPLEGQEYMYPQWEAFSYPAPFEYAAEEITFDELTDIVRNKNLHIYLPTWMPASIKLTAIHYSESLVMFSYSNKGITNYRYDNVTIEISLLYHRTPSPEELVQSAQDKPDVKVLNVNGIWVVILENAHWGEPMLEELYGPSPFAYFWIDNHYYMISVTPPITSDQLVKIIESVRPLTN